MFEPITRAQGVGLSEQVVSSVEPSVAFGRFCLVRSWQDAAVDSGSSVDDGLPEKTFCINGCLSRKQHLPFVFGCQIGPSWDRSDRFVAN